jgi:chemotaxis protein histidine kinase CheA
MGEMDDIVKDFLVESNENLDQLDRDLVTLEKDPTAREVLASIFRTIHTIKGTSGFLGFSRLGSVTHVGESLLSNLRDGRLLLNAEITSGLLAMVDAVRQILVNIENSGQEGEADYTALIDTLSSLQKGEKSGGGSSSAPIAVPPAPATPQPQAVISAPAPPDPPEAHENSGASPKAALPLGEILVQAGHASPEQVRDALALKESGDVRRLGEILVERGVTKPAVIQEALQGQADARASALSESNIRVDVGLLDKLMNLVGELVLARNQILQYSSSLQDTAFLGTTQRLNLITTELQESVMKTRMQPIGNIWSKFPRVVRDLATACGKHVAIEMEGKETELDKTIIESIKDPLTHLIRNAVDHGVEAPEKRVAAGKSPEGHLLLRAFHEGGQVNIEISDDGAGVDLERVKQKALEKGLLLPDQAARLTDREILSLLFLPGFSTAEKVTNVSGRGVGMDVVKTNIEKIGGTVDIQNRFGQGTTLKIKIPLTLAIIPALIVTCGGDRYAIPQVSLLELVRLEGEQARKGIEKIHCASVYRLRGKLLPLVKLNHELGLGRVGNHAGGNAAMVSTTVAAADSCALDVASVCTSHRLWKSRLREFINDKGALTTDEAGSYKDCALGKWFDSLGLQQLGRLPEMRQLGSLHQKFHGTAREVVAAKSSGDTTRAERELTQVDSLSRQIDSLFKVLERSIGELNAINIVVLHADDRQFGLVVDEINDTEEIVVKPLGKQLKGIPTFAGATIMGDGQVALILDVLGLAQLANVVSEVRDRSAGDKVAEAESRRDDGESLLLLAGPGNSRMAMPLSLVARLEEFPHTAVEMAEGHEVVQYRGEILPLISLSSVLFERRREPRDPSPAEPDGGKIQVVVYTDHDRSVGIIVDRILDITREAVRIGKHSGRQGALGSMVVQGSVTELLDVKGIVQAAFPNFFEDSGLAAGGYVPLAVH